MRKRMLQIVKNIAARVSLLTVGMLCFLALMLFAFSSVETTNDAEKKAALEDAILRSALHCYSIEGAYPDSVAYLEENYSLTINWDDYIVHYELFASNIAPDITVITKTENTEGTA